MTNWDKVRPEDFARFIESTHECYMCGACPADGDCDREECPSGFLKWAYKKVPPEEENKVTMQDVFSRLMNIYFFSINAEEMRKAMFVLLKEMLHSMAETDPKIAEQLKDRGIDFDEEAQA